jgi:hypothetical protein
MKMDQIEKITSRHTRKVCRGHIDLALCSTKSRTPRIKAHFALKKIMPCFQFYIQQNDLIDEIEEVPSI